MGLSRKFVFLIFLFIIGFNSNGCSSVEDYIRVNEEEGLEATQAKHDAIVADTAHYVGKNKSELRMMFGEPSKVISPATWNNVDYDAEWVYEQGIPFINKQYRMFYIKNDIVVHVEFGGIF